MVDPKLLEVIHLFLDSVSVVLWLMLADIEEPNYEHMLRRSWSSDKSLEKMITEIGNYLINVPKARVEPLQIWMYQALCKLCIAMRNFAINWVQKFFKNCKKKKKGATHSLF